MALGTKRAEIQRLEEAALRRETEIAEAEAILDRDLARLDEQLRISDAEAVEALKVADTTSRKRTAHQQALRQRQALLLTLRAESARQAEHLEQCRQYKEFLRQFSAQGNPDDLVSPGQILDVLRHIEEQNLLLIQSVQEAQERKQHAQDALDAAHQEGSSQVPALMAEHERLSACLRDARRTLATTEATGISSSAELEEVLQTIRESYRMAELGDLTDPVRQLSAIERGLHDAMAEVQKLPADFVLQTEKVLDSQRREALRKQRTQTGPVTTTSSPARPATQARQQTHPVRGASSFYSLD